MNSTIQSSSDLGSSRVILVSFRAGHFVTSGIWEKGKFDRNGSDLLEIKNDSESPLPHFFWYGRCTYAKT
jgi:hypothetical protein